jgi:hypothetical protein
MAAKRQDHRRPTPRTASRKIAAQKISQPSYRLNPHAARERWHHRHAKRSEVRFLLSCSMKIRPFRSPPARPSSGPLLRVTVCHDRKPAKSVLRMFPHWPITYRGEFSLAKLLKYSRRTLNSFFPRARFSSIHDSFTWVNSHHVCTKCAYIDYCFTAIVFCCATALAGAGATRPFNSR